ncbi:hypothetical protein VTL71DRAFT_7548 [Oculimacula yallundae]|uniref:Uncharacterized protein n=1 Tax=Oculimacula yallundae TaxID=86028 RepID=A0ABR4BUH7_9HELO
MPPLSIKVIRRLVRESANPYPGHEMSKIQMSEGFGSYHGPISKRQNCPHPNQCIAYQEEMESIPASYYFADLSRVEDVHCLVLLGLSKTLIF